MMKSRLLGAVCACILLISGAVQASLIEDTVFVEHHAPNVGVIVAGPTPVYVIAGGSDAISIFNYTVNIEAESILVNFTSGGFPDVDFSGLVVRDLDWVGSPNGIVTGATIDTNLPGWDDTRFSFTDDSVMFNWESLIATPSTLFNVTLLTSHTVVPIPSAVWLFGSGLLGLIGMARRKKAT